MGDLSLLISDGRWADANDSLSRSPLVMGDGREVVGARGSLSRAPLVLGGAMMPWRASPSSETPIAVGMDV